MSVVGIYINTLSWMGIGPVLQRARRLWFVGVDLAAESTKLPAELSPEKLQTL